MKANLNILISEIATVDLAATLTVLILVGGRVGLVANRQRKTLEITRRVANHRVGQHCPRRLACVPLNHNRRPASRSGFAPLSRGLMCKRVLTPFVFQPDLSAQRILSWRSTRLDPSQRLTLATLKYGVLLSIFFSA